MSDHILGFLRVRYFEHVFVGSRRSIRAAAVPCGDLTEKRAPRMDGRRR